MRVERKQFEYKEFEGLSLHQLNALGRNGWWIVSTKNIKDFDENYYTGLMMREYVEETEDYDSY